MLHVIHDSLSLSNIPQLILCQRPFFLGSTNHDTVFSQLNFRPQFLQTDEKTLETPRDRLSSESMIYDSREFLV